MSEIHLVKRPGGIVDPVGPDDAAAWGAVELDQPFAATIRRPRNAKFHRFAWAIVTLAADNWPGDNSPTPEQVMRWLENENGASGY